MTTDTPFDPVAARKLAEKVLAGTAVGFGRSIVHPLARTLLAALDELGPTYCAECCIIIPVDDADAYPCVECGFWLCGDEDCRYEHEQVCWVKEDRRRDERRQKDNDA